VAGIIAGVGIAEGPSLDEHGIDGGISGAPEQSSPVGLPLQGTVAGGRVGVEEGFDCQVVVHGPSIPYRPELFTEKYFFISVQSRRKPLLKAAAN
jgi:hypothetical protein